MDNKKGNQMNRYAIFQLSDENPKIRDMYFLNSSEIEEISDEYELVGIIRAKNLEQAFTIGNVWAKDRIEIVGDMRSVSVGDILQNLETGETVVVARVGFEKIEMKEAI
jgi:hypothetical protein